MDDSKAVLTFLHTSIIAKLHGLFPTVSAIDTNEFWLRFLKLIRTDVYQKYIEQRPITFVVNFTSRATGGTCYLNTEELEPFLKTTARINNILHIDAFGKNFEPNPFDSDQFDNLEDVSDSSKLNEFLYIFVRGNELKIIHKQILIKDIPDYFSVDRVGHIKAMLPIQEYNKLLDRHYQTEIKGERGLEYWKNKSNYQLIAAPENKFRRKLANFLENNLTGAFIDQEAPNNNSSDRNDIRVLTLPSHQVYIIEIKWVGKSEGNDYDGKEAHKKANEGYQQLNLYIDDEPKCVKGVLLIYDARKNPEPIKWIHNDTNWHPLISNPAVLLHLDPTSSSTKAKEIVKSAKNG
jgi:hypothetical protein